MGKNIFLFCMILTLMLAGCGMEKQNTNLAETTADTIAASASAALRVAPEDRNQAFNDQNFVETPEGCYFGWYTLLGDEFGNLICFCPRGGTAFYILCSKPNCRHQDKDCNAYFDGSCFGYFDGALYAVNDGVGKLDVIKMNLDGTDHRVAARVKLKQMGGYQYGFHHGKLLLRSQNTFFMGVDELPDYLIALDLSDGSQTEPLAEYLQTEKLPASFYWYYKDKVFGLENHNDQTLTEVNVSTGEVLKRELGSVTSFCATDSTLYYFLAEGNEYGGEEAKTEPGFWEYDLESGTAAYCGLPFAGIWRVTYDGEYIYAEANQDDPDADPILYILSGEYELLDTVTLENDLILDAAASDRLYFIYASGMDPISCYLEKSQIGSHNLTLIPIETIG